MLKLCIHVFKFKATVQNVPDQGFYNSTGSEKDLIPWPITFTPFLVSHFTPHLLMLPVQNTKIEIEMLHPSEGTEMLQDL